MRNLRLGEKIKSQIINIAKEFIKNDDGSYSQELEYFLEDFMDAGEETDFYDFFNVFQCIAKDGYNISGFELYEIPHPNVYTFFNKEKQQMFDICTDFYALVPQKPVLLTQAGFPQGMLMICILFHQFQKLLKSMIKSYVLRHKGTQIFIVFRHNKFGFFYRLYIRFDFLIREKKASSLLLL